MTKKNLYVAYNKRSCVSGRLLFDYLKGSQLRESFFIRRTNKLGNKKPADVVVRYGSSKPLVTSNGFIEANTREAVENAADKLKMAQTLSLAEGVNFPTLIPIHAMDDVPFLQSFVRDANDHVRYVDLTRGDRVLNTDKYLLRVVDKVKEYRIHIFNGKTVGVYEKVPNDGDIALLMKQDTCSFVRLDMGDEANREQLKGARPMSRAAVEAIGLLYGGVDIMKDRSGVWYVNEVNSSPGLNSLNVERIGDLFIDYINDNLSETTE